MKILYSHRTKSADGQYLHIKALTDALRDRGHEVEIAGPGETDGHSVRPLDAKAGANAIRRIIPAPFHEAAERGYSIASFPKLEKHARRFAPDIIYERYSLFYNAGIRLARARNIPLLLEVNAPLASERAKYGGLTFTGSAAKNEAHVWRSADRILPVTNALARLIEEAGVPAEKITIVGNAVDSDFTKQHDARKIRQRYGLGDAIILGFAGFVRDWHRLDMVIRYLAARRDRYLRLLIVGDGDACAELRAMARKHGVTEKLVITGVIQRDEAPAHIASFDIALQPAATPYSSPLKLVEYLAAGRAIVAPRMENIIETIGDEQAALLFEPDDEASFAAALDALIESKDLRDQYGKAARSAFSKHGRLWSDNARLVEEIAEGELQQRR
ncbi:MAG: glycosyltransferase family 4 protein [Parvularculaceae bacterium]